MALLLFPGLPSGKLPFFLSVDRFHARSRRQTLSFNGRNPPVINKSYLECQWL